MKFSVELQMVSKVAIAMSGGVDSSVAAAIAVEKYGADSVFGVTMKLFCHTGKDTTSDAAAVCKQLGIPHYIVNLEKEFENEIINDFVSEYSVGRTPNPCVRCNSLIKFKYLLIKVQKLGADLLVTGHYARIDYSSSEVEKTKPDSSRLHSNNRTYHLRKGIDEHKDQSYFLYNLSQKQLSHIWFPLGELTKAETRKLAGKYKLKTAQKAESQDICFVTTTIQDFLSSRIEVKPGDIVDYKGKKLGKHEGLPFYTIGQRKGLGGGFTEPMYVTRPDLVRNELVVGKEEELFNNEMLVTDVTWISEASHLQLPVNLDVKIRYNSEPAPAIVKGPTLNSSEQRDEGSDPLQCVTIKFEKPQKAITPGQTAVFYFKDEVIGGGLISSTRHG